MAKRVIVLETNKGSVGMNQLRVVMWFAVPLAKRVPRPELVQSAWSGASQAEIDALKDGSVFEMVKLLDVPTSNTNAENKTFMEDAWADTGTELAAVPFKLAFSGVFWDSASGWSA